MPLWIYFVLYNRSRLTPPPPLLVILCCQARTYLCVASDSRHWYVVGFVFFMPCFDLSCYAMLSQMMLTFVLFNFCSTCTGCLFLSPLVNRFTGIGVFFIFIYCFYITDGNFADAVQLAVGDWRILIKWQHGKCCLLLLFIPLIICAMLTPCIPEANGSKYVIP